MNLHKQIIGISWISFGALVLSLIVLSFNAGKPMMVALGIAEGALFVGAGFALLANLRNSSWICLPCSALSLFSFPIGTVLGIYYLWYYFKVEKAPQKKE
ncbi:MAG TPA: hypothetical protein VFP33_05970 [Gallionella sp.]|nr:hypothetical protein [Gallionella sp.]